MGAFQRLPKGRPWGGFHSPWRCWACRPCWALSWWTPSTMSTTATQPRSCRSSFQIRRQAWWWRRWFMMVPTATAGFRRQFFHHLPLLRHRLMREPQQPQQPQPPPPPQRTTQQNIHHRPHPQQQQRQRQQQLGTQRAQEEEEQRQQPLGPEEEGELALQTTLEPPLSSGRKQLRDRVQYFWTLDHLPELKTSPFSRTLYAWTCFLCQGHCSVWQ